MKEQDPQKDKQLMAVEKHHYDPPEATVVRVELEERVLGCNFSSWTYCRLTE